METRKITVILEAGNGDRVIESGAETLGELKADLASNNINYEGMTFREGLTRTELVDDFSVLPKDVNYKGRITNELVFVLQTANKKIKSGGTSRAELYTAIKNAGVQDDIKATFGKNFTMVSTMALEDFLQKHKAKQVKGRNTTTASKVATVKAHATETAKEENRIDILEAKFNSLLDLLLGLDLVDRWDVDDIRDMGPGAKSSNEASPYSAEELKAFKF